MCKLLTLYIDISALMVGHYRHKDTYNTKLAIIFP